MIPFAMSKAKKLKNPRVSTKTKAVTEMRCFCLKIRSECEARSAQFQRKDIASFGEDQLKRSLTPDCRKAYHDGGPDREVPWRVAARAVNEYGKQRHKV